MLRSLQNLSRYNVVGEDRRFGPVRDYLFDDDDWLIRYFVLDTESWLPEKRVLISPVSFSASEGVKQRTIPVVLTTEDVETSPPLDHKKPLSRFAEEKIATHYNWPIYWGSADDSVPPLQPAPYRVTNDANEDSPLGAWSELRRCTANSAEGELGYIEDLIVAENSWRVHYLVLNVETWAPEKKVLVSPQWVEAIHWHDREILLHTTFEDIESSPPYKSEQLVDKNRDTRAGLQDYNQRLLAQELAE